MSDGPMIRSGADVSHRILMCEPLRMEYDFTRRRGLLFMANGDCCDMDGCISIFKAIDQDVTLIETWSGEMPDTYYARTSTDAWQAMKR